MRCGPPSSTANISLNHGANFYPLALAFRLTPVIVLGLIAALIAIVVAAWKQQRRRRLFAVIVLLIGTALFIALHHAGRQEIRSVYAARRSDVDSDRGLGHRANPIARGAPIAVIGAAVLVLLNWPYLLMHYNLLLGGAPEAQNHFAVGWGEGLGAAANWINQQPDGLQSTAATSAVPSFAPIFSGQSRNTYDRDLELSDYYVLTLSERQLIPEFYADLLQRGEIVQTLRTGTGRWRVGAAQQAGALQAEALQRREPADRCHRHADRSAGGARVCRRRARLVLLPRDVTTDELEQILNDLSTKYQRLWFAWSPAVSPVVQQQMRDWLAQTATLARAAQILATRRLPPTI